MIPIDAISVGATLSALACVVFAYYSFFRPRRVTKDRRRVVVVSGAASGLGRATCMALAENGDWVIALDLNAEGLANTYGKKGQARYEARAWARKHTVARCRGRTVDRQFLIRQEPKIRTYLRGKRRERVSRVDG